MPAPSFAPLNIFLVVARLKSFSAAARELAVSPSAVSQAVRSLEAEIGTSLLLRTTRSMALTDAGRRLVEGAGPGLAQAAAALAEVAAGPGEMVGRVRLSVPRMAVPSVVEPTLALFRTRHPRIDVEVEVDDRFVDIVADGFDAGVRLSEAIERDMVQVRLTEASRFVVVGAPSYFAAHGRPARPEDLLKHDCVTFRSQTNGALYAWELERGRKSWRVPVRGGIVTNDGALQIALALKGQCLAYAFEPTVSVQLRKKRLETVLDAYAPSVTGFFLYYPSRAQSSKPLRLFVEAARAALRNARGDR